MAKIVRLPVPAPDVDDANNERTERLFDWAVAVLKGLGIEQEIKRANSIEELRRVKLSLESADIALAIRDALHPASGDRAKHFRCLSQGNLKQILKNRFNDLKKDREKVLRRY